MDPPGRHCSADVDAKGYFFSEREDSRTWRRRYSIGIILIVISFKIHVVLARTRAENREIRSE